MAEVVEKPLAETPAGRAAAIPPKKALKASASAQGVKIVPGHGVAGRHARRDHLYQGPSFVTHGASVLGAELIPWCWEDPRHANSDHGSNGLCS